MSDKDKKVVPLTEEQLKQKEVSLQEKENTLNTREESLNQREEALNTKEADLNKLEEDLLKTEPSEEVKEIEPGLEFSYEKENFKFRDESPKKILMSNGKKMTQSEIVKDKEALASIINGNLIQRIK